MAKSNKAINGLERAKEIILSNIKNPKTRRLLLANITNAENLIEEQAGKLEEQDERIAIMQESDNLGGLFLEVLAKYGHAQSEILAECCGKELEQEEKALADELTEYINRATACGFGFPVFNIEEGHARIGLQSDEKTRYIAVWYSTPDYAEPGPHPQATGKETPVFGLRLRDARHAELISETFGIIAEMIKKEGAET